METKVTDRTLVLTHSVKTVMFNTEAITNFEMDEDQAYEGQEANHTYENQTNGKQTDSV